MFPRRSARRTAVCAASFCAILLLCVAGGRATAASDAPFLWEIQGPHARHFLLGSVHLLPDNGEELPDSIAAAYDASDGLVFETDVGAINDTQTGLNLLAVASAPRGLRAEISDTLYAQLTRTAGRIGMPMSLCDPYKPWFCAITLEVFTYRNAGFASSKGVDEQVYRWAENDKKEVSWLEQPSAQFEIFTRMSRELSQQFLASEMDDDGGDDPAAMLKAWRNNDVAAMENMVHAMRERYPEVYERLLAARNRNWLPQLSRIANSDEPRLVVVGAAHCVGADGLVEQLRLRGFRVRPYVPDDSSRQLTPAAFRRHPGAAQAALLRR